MRPSRLPAFRPARRLTAGLVLALLALAPPAAGQLELPRKGTKPAKAPAGESLDPRRQRGDLAPHLTCTVCWERNYTAPRGASNNGFHQVWCTVCKKSTLHRDSFLDRKAGGLALPESLKSGTPAPAQRAPSAAEASAATALDLSDDAILAQSELQRLARVTSPADPEIARVVQRLLVLGEAGRVASRLALASDHGPRLLAAANVLLVDGLPQDADSVVRRLEGGVPNDVAPALVELVARLDPVRASPELFVRLLDHRQSGVRTAALRRVRSMPSSAVLPLLEELFRSRRADTRLKAVDIASGIAGLEATELLVANVADPSARVAGAIVSALARREDPDLDAELLKIAFGERWLLRAQAYALLALMEREDTLLRPILDESQIDPLLDALGNSDPFISGTCAAALAGIGFRSRHPRETAWLDHEVPERLVMAASGRSFHNDYSSLLGPALRRLRLITDARLGSDGPAWVGWWVESRDGFHAQRASLEVGPEGADALALAFRAGGAAPTAFVLVGPEAERALGDRPGERLVLASAEAADLLRVLEQEGALGPTRLPGLHGAHGSAERTLEVALGGQTKSFQYGAGSSEAWFERVVAMAMASRERNRWQRYPPPELAASPRLFLERESAFWSSVEDERSRARRLADLVLAWLAPQPLTNRDAALTELERLYAVPDVADAIDYPVLLQRLEEERFRADRSRRLVGLALRAGTAERGDGVLVASRELAQASLASAAEVLAAARLPGLLPLTAAGLAVAAPSARAAPAVLERARALELVDLLHDRFGPPAAEDLARVYSAAGRAFARELAASPRALLRAVAGAVLAHDPEPGDVELLIALLADDATSVQVAVIRALGVERVEAARTELLLRARIAVPDVRKEALRAIGGLGGEYVYEALLLGISDSDPSIRIAAAQGMALLGDPRAVTSLVRMLDEPRDSEAYAAGISGLERLGGSARPALARIVHTREHPARRDAALLLARQDAAEVVPALIALVAEDPSDERLAFELCVLTCVDARGTPEAEQAWWTWWDGVVHDDPLAWFLAALERHELEPPPASAFRDKASMNTALYLLGVIESGQPWLAERARRELGLILGRDVPAVPPAGAERERWLAVARRWIDPGFDR